MPSTHTLESQWAGDDRAREGTLKAARAAATLSKPWVLPPEGQQPDDELPESFQSLGSRGIQNLEGKLLIALFPPGIPWFTFKIQDQYLLGIHGDPEAEAAAEQMDQELFRRELIVLSLLEAAQLDVRRKMRRSGFRSHKRKVLSQILVTGDALELINDDYRIRSFRRDAYVTRRDSTGDVLYHITREKIDPLALNDEQRSRAQLPQEQTDQTTQVQNRMVDLYTKIEWQPWAQTWMITQEINQRTVNTSEETVSPYFSTPFELADGQHYGRGFIELNIGDLRSLNELSVRSLEQAANASKVTPALDYGAQTRETDLQKESGVPIRARVRDGQVTDVGFLHADTIREFSMIEAAINRIGRELGKAMQMETEAQPKGDRVTAFQVQRVAMELEGVLGGLYAPIADDQQVPLLRRVVHQAERDRVFPPMPKHGVEVMALTGIAALQREVDSQKLMSAVSAIVQLGPDAIRRLDMGVLVRKIMRHVALDEPGLVKSDEEIAAEDQAMAQQQLALAAGEQAVESTGRIAEQQAQGAA